MLLSKTVKIKWNGRNKEWYKKKGYNFTKINDEFKIKVEDLPKGSNVLIKIKCDKCGKKSEIMYRDYNKNIHKDNKYYCRKCGIILFGIKKIKKTKLKQSKSFEQWCIDNDKKYILDRWDYKLNKDIKPNEVAYGTQKKYWFKCPRGIHESELKNIKSFTSDLSSIGCNQCNSFAQWGIDNICEDFLDRYWDYEKNNKININPWEINTYSMKQIFIKCQKKVYHGSYKVQCSSFTNMNSRCPYCSHKGNEKIHPLDSLGQYIVDNYGEDFPNKIWSEKNKKSPYEYAPSSNQKVWWKCPNNKHKDYKRNINDSNIYDFRCSECTRERKESFLQEKVRLYLEDLGYTILHEYNTLKCINPKTKYRLPYDNEIKELNFIIEVHGQQHYSEVGGKWSDYKIDLHYQKLKDRYKRIYAKSQGYEYLEIPYWTDNEKEEWKELINNKINKIINYNIK
ncbi:zinc-ribbon domain-containing protein [Clostridium sporogenes]|uniref:zinc-ribbon domain-containing protein n=1 Tax=Clostridium sporogenes TaxID=1509 RepID=UPI0013D384E7|nr:zinc-ribbon domain-containing protein [Clostridium sporogenes]NFH40702.1 hypothetical protein [Clostridium sporogenes]